MNTALSFPVGPLTSYHVEKRCIYAKIGRKNKKDTDRFWSFSRRVSASSRSLSNLYWSHRKGQILAFLLCPLQDN